MSLATKRYVNEAVRRGPEHPRRLENPAAGGMDYDYLFVGSMKVTPPARTTNFLKIMLDGSGASWVAAMPETQDSDAVVIDVTKNRIYLSGEFGGG